jgi:hypothetical protein
MSWFEGFMRLQAARDAVASVSLSHPTGCVCTVCKAAHGDVSALAEVMVMIEEKET